MSTKFAWSLKKNTNKLRTMYPKSHEIFKNNNHRVQLFIKKECNSQDTYTPAISLSAIALSSWFWALVNILILAVSFFSNLLLLFLPFDHTSSFLSLLQLLFPFFNLRVLGLRCFLCAAVCVIAIKRWHCSSSLLSWTAIAAMGRGLVNQRAAVASLQKTRILVRMLLILVRVVTVVMIKLMTRA